MMCAVLVRKGMPDYSNASQTVKFFRFMLCIVALVSSIRQAAYWTDCIELQKLVLVQVNCCSELRCLYQQAFRCQSVPPLAKMQWLSRSDTNVIFAKAFRPLSPSQPLPFLTTSGESLAAASASCTTLERIIAHGGVWKHACLRDFAPPDPVTPTPDVPPQEWGQAYRELRSLAKMGWAEWDVNPMRVMAARRDKSAEAELEYAKNVPLPCHSHATAVFGNKVRGQDLEKCVMLTNL